MYYEINTVQRKNNVVVFYRYEYSLEGYGNKLNKLSQIIKWYNNSKRIPYTITTAMVFSSFLLLLLLLILNLIHYD